MATILVVDDHPMNRDFLSTLLGYQKHRILEASDGVQALAIARLERIDLIISDILMPNLDGYEMAKIIRADQTLATIPIIFYTATYSTREANMLAAACGVTCVIIKPAEPQEILDQVRLMLGSSASNEELFFLTSKKKDRANIQLGKNLSIFFDELDTTNQFLSALVPTAALNNETKSDDVLLRETIKKLQENSLKMSSLLKLGFNLMTERDPLRMFKLFSRAVCNLMPVYQVTIGIIDHEEQLSGRFCTTILNNSLEAHYSNTDILAAPLLRALYFSQDVIRFTELNQAQLTDPHAISQFENRAFLGVPIFSSTQKYGVFYLIGKGDGQGFSLEDERMATTMAAELAVLYENIKLYDLIQQHAVKLQLEITERKQVENDLRQSEERLKLALEAGHMNGWEWNVQTNVINEFGYFDPISRHVTSTATGTLDHFISSIIPEDRARILAALHQAVKDGKDYEAEFRSNMADGSTQWIAARAQLYFDSAGNAERMVGIGVIVTERKKAEELARQHQANLASVARVNSMGEMASALAHELAQPLTVINSYLGGCIRRIENSDTDHAAIILAMQKAMQNVELAGEIIHRMKNFVRKGELQYETIALNEVIQAAVALIHFEIYDTPVAIHFNLTPGLPLLEIDKIQIEQVILNLVRNGIEAMRNANVRQPTLHILTEQTKPHLLTVTIQDCGPGIAPHVSHLLFTPYFTTKPNGMGMGLAICRTIIEAHGGQLSAMNLATQGACFKFTLPVLHND